MSDINTSLLKIVENLLKRHVSRRGAFIITDNELHAALSALRKEAGK